MNINMRMEYHKHYGIPHINNG